MLSVLLADDERLALLLLRKMIPWDQLGFKIVASAADGDELYAKIKSDRPGLVITDIEMPGRNGLETIARTVEEGLDTQFIIISAYANFTYARRAMQLGAVDFLPKPVPREELESALGKVKENLQGKSPREESCRTIIETARKYIEENYSRHLGIREVSDYVYISASYFSSLFKKETGVSFVDYVTDVRMKKAKQLLADPRYSIAQVAQMCGFGDAKYFSNVFRKKFDQSPQQFRKG